jgi:hypothetical protein
MIRLGFWIISAYVALSLGPLFLELLLNLLIEINSM